MISIESRGQRGQLRLDVSTLPLEFGNDRSDAFGGGLRGNQALSVLKIEQRLACLLKALLGGLPLALGSGVGSELRRPLGISIVGGLLISQILTLYTTPVIYLYMVRLGAWLRPKSPPGGEQG